MILAGLILKLGGVGLIVLRCTKLNSTLIVAIRVLSLIGGALFSIRIIGITDIKLIIACSSIVHISIITVNTIMARDIRIKGVI